MDRGANKNIGQRRMSAKGSTNTSAYKGSFQVFDIGEFIRFSDGSKLRAAATENSSSQYGTNPLDVGNIRLYESSGTLYVCLKDLTAPNPNADSNLAGYRVLQMLGVQ